MKFILENDKLKIEQEKELNSGSLNYYEVDVEFNEAWQNLTIVAILIGKDDIVGTSISVIKNKFYLDNELEGYYNIGFVGYLIENEEKKYQISTNLKSIYFNKGAGEIETEDKKVPTPSEWEIYIAQIQKMISDIKIEELDPTVPEYVKKITENDISNWNNKAEKDDIPDTSNFITNTVNDLVNYYKKSETYSKQEIDNKISLIPKFSIEIVSSLPTENISETTLYLLKSGTEKDNIYTEYIYSNKKWEILGTQKLDLSNYYNKGEVDKKLEDTTQELETKIAELVLENARQQEDIDSLLEELPDNSVEGSNLHITDSAKARATMIPLGNTEQDTREGYNRLLLNYGDSSFSVNGVTLSYNKLAGKFKVTGIPTADTWINIFPIFRAGTNESVAGESIDVSEKYLVTNYDKWSSASNIALQFTDGSTVTNLNYPGEKYKKFSTDSANRGWIYIPNSGKNLNEEFWVMICDDYNYTEYEQYGSMPSIDYPSDVTVVEGSYENKVQNKNLAIKYSNGYVDGNTGDISSSNNESYFCTDLILIPIGFTEIYYYGSNLSNELDNYWANRVAFFDENKKILGNAIIMTNSRTLTIPTDAKYIRVSFSAEVIDYMLAFGTETGYIEPQEQNYSLDFPIPMAKGDEIELTYTEKNGYKTIDSIYKNAKMSEKIRLTSDMSWALSGNGYWYRVIIPELSINLQSTILSTHFKGVDSNGNKTIYSKNYGTGYICLGTSGNGLVGISVSTFDSLDDLKTFLNENEVYIIGELQSPTRTQITDETFISQYEALLNSSTYKGVTNISTTKQSDTQATLNLKVDYKQSNQIVFSNAIETLKQAIISLGGNI